MKHLSWAVLVVWVLGCTWQAHKPTGPVETQDALVGGCSMLGVISETAEAGWISAYAAKRRMLANVTARADQLGATHIVWLHQTDVSAAAKAYRCPVINE